MTDEETLLAGASALGVLLPPDAPARLAAYGALLEERNKVLNLTRVPPGEYVTRHYLDALTVMPYVVGNTLLDVGSGAGVPGIPLAVTGRFQRVVLLEATFKRVKFLDEAAAAANVSGIVRSVHARAEDAIKDPELRGSFGTVVARAVTRLPKLLEWCLPFLEKGGTFIAMKGKNVAPEVEESSTVLERHGMTARILDLLVPSIGPARSLVICRHE